LVNQAAGRCLKSTLITSDISGQKNKMIYNPEFNFSSLISEIIKVFRKHHFKDLEEKLKIIAKDHHVISSHKEIARKDFIPNLEYSLENITVEMDKFADYISRLSKQLQWHQASRGVPEIFEGGYSFSVIIGDSGLVPSKNIRMGLFLQNQNVDYPSHAHEAEEFYLILSGHGSWQIGNSWYDAIPGRIFHHRPGESHRMITESEPLLAIWIWTGLIEGRYWFVGHEEIDCSINF